MSSEDLLKLKIVELKAMCKERKLPVSGTKAELVNRILGKQEEKKKVKKEKVYPPKIDDKIEPILIKRNKYGNFEHLDTGFVFSSETKKIIGKQQEDQIITSLSIQDMEQVYRYHFTLDSSVNIQDTTHLKTNDDEKSELYRIEELKELL